MIQQTQNGNYSISLTSGEKKEQILCLHNRVVQAVVGSSFAWTISSLFEIEQTLLVTRTAVTLPNILCVITGGIALYQWNPQILLATLPIGFLITYIQDFVTAMVINGIGLFMIGKTLLLSGSFLAACFVTALLIRKFGNENLNNYLNLFNKQDFVNLDVNRSGKYIISLINNEILSFRKKLVVGVLFFSTVICASFENKTMFAGSQYRHIFNILLGLYTIYATGIYKLLIPVWLIISWNIAEQEKDSILALLYPVGRNYAFHVGQGTIITGVFFAALAGLTFLAKKSNHKQTIEFTNYLDKLTKDPVKVKQTDEARKAAWNALMKQDSFTQDPIKLIPDAPEQTIKLKQKESRSTHSTKTSSKMTKVAHANIEIQNRRAKEIQNKTSLQKFQESSEGQLMFQATLKEYGEALSSSRKETWDLLFDTTKTRPDHFALEGSDVASLIAAQPLNGKVVHKNDRHHIQFFNVNSQKWQTLDHYEVAHQGDRHYLTSHYAQNVKDAIEAMIWSRIFPY